VPLTATTPRRRRRRSYGWRRCATCGELFQARTPNARFCPPTAEQAARQKTPRSSCAKRRQNADYRGTDVIVGKPGQPFDCALCGKRCVPGVNVPPHASRFCCRAHKAAFHRQVAA
jgi:hypothetical protein